MSDGNQLLIEANKKLSARGWFGGNKLDEACDLFGKESGDAFMKQGETLEKMGDRDEAAKAIASLKLAVTILTEKGRFSAAAQNMKQIAEIQANAMYLKVAQFAATLEQYDRAITLFESVGEKSLGNNLTKWSVRDYLLKAGICILCTGDHVRAETSFERYKSLDPSFNLLEAINDQDVDRFTSVLSEFDRMTKLDDWKTTLLLRVKKSLEKAAEGDVDIL
ncbi:soluble NSF attachment protein [Gorgonomyces haynaldii]|nr:soluble NSF attachment protein [Gorgonomyces haynaldii]